MRKSSTMFDFSLLQFRIMSDMGYQNQLITPTDRSSDTGMERLYITGNGSTRSSTRRIISIYLQTYQGIGPKTDLFPSQSSCSQLESVLASRFINFNYEFTALKLQYTDLTRFAVLDPPLDRQSRISDPSFRSSSIIYILRPQI
ncbi:uncharacterized protein RSE6_06308 [Rhynchosporium secalis]|uniref:Uncharacterized protein n=1 Tax=Rhynchosporium secalis TaxID=38038 RepID=A0A1E1MA48_RHYSE|nr:uncharacterized protein RSE6_06308 [Rhynchosporium secalis]